MRADLRGANLGGANLKTARLMEADLRGANLEEANLMRTYLKEAKIDEKCLETILKSIHWETAQFDFTVRENLEGMKKI